MEEKKLGVTLVSPSSSPIDEALKEEIDVGVSEPNNLCTAVEKDLDRETSNKSDEMFNVGDSLPPESMVKISQLMSFLHPPLSLSQIYA